jgi:uncharacterized protein YndB with AHSA1/START domain
MLKPDRSLYTMAQRIDKTIIIEATPSAVWDRLTNPDLMKQWMAEPEIGIEIITDWKVGSPIIIKGFHHIKFENKGTVLQFEPGKVLQYNYLSSLSRLPDSPENYSIVEFRLAPLEHHTSLTLTISNFPTEIIFKHVDFYWKTTIVLLKKFIENLS